MLENSRWFRDCGPSTAEYTEHDLLEHRVLGSVEHGVDCTVGKKEYYAIQEEIIQFQHDEDTVGKRKDEANTGNNEEVFGNLNLVLVDTLLTLCLIDHRLLHRTLFLRTCTSGEVSTANSSLILEVALDEHKDESIRYKSYSYWHWEEDPSQNDLIET